MFSHVFIAISLSNFLHCSGPAFSIDFCSVCLKDDQENRDSGESSRRRGKDKEKGRRRDTVTDRDRFGD